MTDDEIRDLYAHIEAFNRMSDAFQRRDLRGYLWLCAGIGHAEHDTRFLQARFGVTRQQIQHAFVRLGSPS